MGVNAKHILLMVQRFEQKKGSRYYAVKRVLSAVGIRNFTTWVGAFDPNQKMRKSYHVLRNITGMDQFVFHSDTDEFPERVSFEAAWNELQTGSCDALKARWTDRVAETGRLRRVTASNESIHLQYPYRCDLSTQFVGGQKTTKALVYRAPFRVDGGQHEVWCDRDGFTRAEKREMITKGDTAYLLSGPGVKNWNREKACTRHIAARGKHAEKKMIMKYISDTPYRPRYCKTEVDMDHYKWIDGIRAYLYKRAIEYRKQGLHWWRDSRDILMHIQYHDGRICVWCKEAKCVDTRMAQIAPIDPLEVFYSRRDYYGRASWSRKRKDIRGELEQLIKNGTLEDTPAARDKFITERLGTDQDGNVVADTIYTIGGKVVEAEDLVAKSRAVDLWEDKEIRQRIRDQMKSIDGPIDMSTALSPVALDHTDDGLLIGDENRASSSEAVPRRGPDDPDPLF